MRSYVAAMKETTEVGRKEAAAEREGNTHRENITIESAQRTLPSTLAHYQTHTHILILYPQKLNEHTMPKSDRFMRVDKWRNESGGKRPGYTRSEVCALVNCPWLRSHVCEDRAHIDSSFLSFSLHWDYFNLPKRPAVTLDRVWHNPTQPNVFSNVFGFRNRQKHIQYIERDQQTHLCRRSLFWRPIRSYSHSALFPRTLSALSFALIV